MNSRKFEKEVTKLAHEHGFTLKRKKKHLVWEHVLTKFIAVTSATASDGYALAQASRVFRKVALKEAC